MKEKERGGNETEKKRSEKKIPMQSSGVGEGGAGGATAPPLLKVGGGGTAPPLLDMIAP